MSSPLARILIFGSALAMLALPHAHAYVPDAREACEERNSALCEVNGVTLMQAAPCAATAKTLRPPGREDCSKAHEAPPKVYRAEPAPQPAAAPHTDFAYLGRTERWLLPLLAIGGSLLLGGLVIYILSGWWRRKQPGRGNAPYTLTVLLGSTAIGLVAAYHAAGAVYLHVDANFHNHDSAAPALISGAAALFAFGAVLSLASTLSALVLHSILHRIWRRD